MWVFRVWLVGFAALLLLLASGLSSEAQVTTPPTSGSGLMSNFLESLISNSAEASGGALVPVTDASVGSALTAEAGIAASAEGLGAGTAMTFAGLGLAAAGAFAAGAGLACLTVAQDVCGQVLGNTGVAWAGIDQQGIPVPYGASLYQCQANGTYYVGTDWAAVALQCVHATGHPNVTSCTYVAANQWNCTPGNYVEYVFPDTTNVIPSSGLNCGSSMFQVASLSATLACSQAVPGTGSVLGPNQLSASNFRAPQNQPRLNEPVDPALLAQMGNAVAQQMAGTSAGGSNSANPSQPSPLPHPITPAMVQTVEQQTGITPKLSDLLAPLGPSNQVVVSNGQTSVTGVTQPTNQSLSPVSSGLSPSAAQQKQGTPCGNLLAGEPDCSVSLDMTFNPETGCWEYMGATALARTTDDCSNNPGQNKDKANLGPLQDLTTQLLRQALNQDTASKSATVNSPNVNVTTSPNVALQNLTKTQDATLSKTGETLTNKYPPPNTPVITLPFDEWPQVFQAFNISVPNISGQCPKVSFTVQSLNNTTFTFATQCLIMDSLKPYMQYVLPPTYLFMALLWIMAA